MQILIFDGGIANFRIENFRLQLDRKSLVLVILRMWDYTAPTFPGGLFQPCGDHCLDCLLVVGTGKLFKRSEDSADKEIITWY